VKLSSWLTCLGVLAMTASCASVHRSGAHPRVARVAVRNFAFDPGTIEISLGDTVEWVNHDAFTHSAVADGRSFDTGNIPGEEGRAFVPREKGTIAYHCSWHPTMRATIVVK
jgi:plastocyanin